MAGHYKSLKRKVDGVVNHITDDFSDFSLSSPATKIRRLDAELPPIVEEDDEHLDAPNDERAIVLFKPILHSPSSYSLTLNSHLISEIKNNQLSWSKQCDSSTDYYDDNNNNRHLAIVPWVPQASTSSSHNFEDSEYRNSNTNPMELMEADEMGQVQEEEEEEDGAAMMDVEQEVNNNSSSTFNYPTMLNLHQQVDGFQQHCFLPQIPQNTSTPITWTL
ncbi:unnamed protein product [Trifolium pratense]|uniref:Uncharacterized protein n=1 Tax=Trifolium pratense TaxID=57577 RepID=A0ACB0M6W3_TRIPR|nr:unnamed protein product [Trifolium pratense]